MYIPLRLALALLALAVTFAVEWALRQNDKRVAARRAGYIRQSTHCHVVQRPVFHDAQKEGWW